MADAGNENGIGLFGELGGQLFSFVLEFGEAHLDEFMLLQHLIGARNELRTYAVAAHLQMGVEFLGERPELAFL